MLAYYLDLALRSLRRNVALTALMIAAIAFGVGASMTALTVLRMLSADPIPGKSRQLYYVQLEPRDAKTRPDDDPPVDMTWTDAAALVREGRADRQAMMTGGAAAVQPQRPDLKPFTVGGRWTSAEFFAMFEVPFVAGGGWTASDDASAARVVVLARALADKLFGTIDVIGRSVRVAGSELRVVGVIDTWRPVPHFYDLGFGKFAPSEQLFVPFLTASQLELAHSGTTHCWGDRVENPLALGATCTWVQLWVELDSPAKASAYRDVVVRYSEDQRRAGRFQRPTNVRLTNVVEWLAHNDVVPDDARLQTWIALGFLLVCLVNTVALLLTKFLRRSPEIGVRRALGASRRAVFVQLLVEAGVIGAAGGVIGIGLAWLGLWAVRHQPTPYAQLAHLDLPMLAATVALAITSSLVAGVLPAWRGARITPAIQLKSH